MPAPMPVLPLDSPLPPSVGLGAPTGTTGVAKATRRTRRDASTMEDGLCLDVEQSGLETLEGVNHLAHGLGEAAAAFGTVVTQQRRHELLDHVDGAIGA